MALHFIRINRMGKTVGKTCSDDDSNVDSVMRSFLSDKASCIGIRNERAVIKYVFKFHTHKMRLTN